MRAQFYVCDAQVSRFHWNLPHTNQSPVSHQRSYDFYCSTYCIRNQWKSSAKIDWIKSRHNHQHTTGCEQVRNESGFWMVEREYVRWEETTAHQMEIITPSYKLFVLCVQFDVDCSFVLHSRRFCRELGLSYVTGISIYFVIVVGDMILLVAAAGVIATISVWVNRAEPVDKNFEAWQSLHEHICGVTAAAWHNVWYGNWYNERRPQWHILVASLKFGQEMHSLPMQHHQWNTIHL